MSFQQASNPGQFDSDVDVLWQKGHSPDSVYHAVSTAVYIDELYTAEKV